MMKNSCGIKKIKHFRTCCYWKIFNFASCHLVDYFPIAAHPQCFIPTAPPINLIRASNIFCDMIVYMLYTKSSMLVTDTKYLTTIDKDNRALKHQVQDHNTDHSPTVIIST